MSLMPFAGAAASAFWPLVARLVSGAQALARSRATQIGVVTGVIVDLVNLDWLRERALQFGGGASTPAGLEETARTAARMLGLDGSNVLWPMNRQTGQLILPLYFHVNLRTGQAWYTDRYYSRKMTFLSRPNRSNFRSFRSARRDFGRFGGGGGNTTVVK